ncbi:phosphatase PAP2 family protein, partial [Dermatophilus congolensis]|uniref:phosphatase PAP2 family protein n=1 Tax=Dermatophilus congolensis TaxID=1863 RepID=UPI001AB03F1E
MTLHFSPLSGVFRSRRGSGGVLPGRIVVERAVAVPVLVGGVGLLGGALGLGAFVTRVGAEQTGELALEVTIGRRHTMWLSDVAHLIDLALSPVAAVLVTVVVAWLVARRNVVAGVVVAVAIGGGWLVAGATKLLFLRLRPPMETVRALVSEVGTTSFPSGHTAFACSLLAAMVLLVRMWGRSSAWVWVVRAVLCVP